MIEVKHLTKRYGKHLAVDDLSFTVEKGQIYGFLGPNGAGKSTTMNIMTGYLGATKGEVLIDGHDILKEPEQAKKCIGYLPEQPPVYPDMTVEEYLKFAAGLKQISGEEREIQIEKVMGLTKLGEVRNRLIANLSKGYKQRVGLAQALIRRLAKEHTVILSSHILAEIREVCDYILIIAKGKLVASDTPENLENAMSGAGHVEIEVRRGKEEVAALLNHMSSVKKAEYTLEEDGTLRVQIEARDGKDIREEIFQAFADHRMPLQTLKLNKSTLEEIFLELTQK